jgi:hypothetical protein
MNAMITAALSKKTSPPTSSRTDENTNAVSVPSAIRVSMFAENRRARASPDARIGQPATNSIGTVNANADQRAQPWSPKP